MYSIPTIYFPGEPRPMNLVDYDYEMSYHFSDDPRHYRLPLYALYGDVNRLTEPRIYHPEMFNRKFCCALFGKPYPHERTPREEFFRRLCEYKKVDSAGRYLNNTGFVVTEEHKAKFIKDYKFVLSFESCSLPGFTTEKIYEPLLMNAIPIYWGNPDIREDFSRFSFINCTNLYFDEALRWIVELDTSENAYRSMIENHPRFGEGARKENIVNFIKKVLHDA
jgi:hypothetical protein